MKSASNLRSCWWASLAAMAVIFGALLYDPRYDVVAMLALEFAPTQEAFFATIADSGYTKAFLEKCIYIDYAFIVAFTSLFYFSIIIFAAEYNKKISYQRLFVLVPGLLDVIEDTIMLHMVRHGEVSGLTYNLQMTMVYSKWVLVIPCSILAIMALYKVAGNK
jgi:hypothetical protein